MQRPRCAVGVAQGGANHNLFAIFGGGGGRHRNHVQPAYRIFRADIRVALRAVLSLVSGTGDKVADLWARVARRQNLIAHFDDKSPRLMMRLYQLQQAGLDRHHIIAEQGRRRSRPDGRLKQNAGREREGSKQARSARTRRIEAQPIARAERGKGNIQLFPLPAAYREADGIGFRRAGRSGEIEYLSVARLL